MSDLSTSSSGTQRVLAFWNVSAGRGELREYPLESPTENDVIVRTLYSAISRGSEALVFHGRVPPSEHQRMRAPFQNGEFTFPVQYGYSSVGIVEEGPESLVGRAVFCLHPHQDRFVVPADSVIALPENVPPERAILAANAETALNAIWDAGAGPADRICVVGGGVIGLLVAWLAARLPGARVTLIDIEPARKEVAESLGATFAQPGEAPADQDLVFHCSGQSAGLQTAIEAAGFEARIIELSWYGDQATQVGLGGAFHARRLQIRASQVGHVPPGRRARWSRTRRLRAALSLLADARLDAIIDGETRFEDLPDAMPRICADGATGLCHRVVYPD